MKNKPTTVDVTIVLDRSGSMQSIASDTIGGFNRFLEEQQKQEGKCTFALNQFDDTFEQVYPPTDVKKVTPLTKQTFQPRGSTALLDAIGRTINETGARLEGLKEGDRPDKVIIVVITDGHENASHEFTKTKVTEMLRHQESVYSWEFVFLGADMDAIAEASQYGFSYANTMSNAKSAIGTQAIYTALSANIRSVRSGKKADMSWTAEQKKEQEDLGAKQ